MISLKDKFSKNLFLKVFLFISFFCILNLQTEAGKIYKCKYKSEADIKIYIANYKSEADLIVYVSKYSSEASGKDLIWYYTKYRSDSDTKVWISKYRSDSDITIYFTKYKSEVKWLKKKSFIGSFGGR